MSENAYCRKPNIILINCDDLGYGDPGCYGSKVHSTPYLDFMASKGLKLTSFYMASPVCSPSRGAMMTGCYPRRIGFGSFDDKVVLFPGQGIGLNPHEITMAKTLKSAGYSTMIIGKWHCGDQPDFLPTRHGFDSYFGIPYSNDMGRQASKRELTYPPLPLMDGEKVIQEQPDQACLTERYTEKAVSYIRENKDKPFFLYLAHMYVHRPIYAPERFLKQSRNGAYGAAVECVDWSAGVILHELEKLGLDKDTLVIFTSDNGSRCDYEGSNGPLRGRKGTTWEGGMRLPCIMYWPGTIPEGTVSDEITCSLDLMPTLTLLAGGTLPQDRIIDGLDIRPVIFGETGAKSPREAFFYYWMNHLEAVRVGRYKLHVGKHDRKTEFLEKQLYDLDNDIGETVNIYDSHPEIVGRLEAYLDACRKDLGDALLDIEGENCRKIGRVENPDTLTHYDPNHPYIVALYDLEDRG